MVAEFVRAGPPGQIRRSVCDDGGDGEVNWRGGVVSSAGSALLANARGGLEFLGGLVAVAGSYIRAGSFTHTHAPLDARCGLLTQLGPDEIFGLRRVVARMEPAGLNELV